MFLFFPACCLAAYLQAPSTGQVYSEPAVVPFTDPTPSQDWQKSADHVFQVTQPGLYDVSLNLDLQYAYGWETGAGTWLVELTLYKNEEEVCSVWKRLSEFEFAFLPLHCLVNMTQETDGLVFKFGPQQSYPTDPNNPDGALIHFVAGMTGRLVIK